MRKTAILLVLALAGCAGSTVSNVPSDAPLQERERLLTRALVNREVATLNQLLTDDFTCEAGDLRVRIAPSVKRRTLCTGYGHQRPGSENGPDLSRSALIRSIDVQESTPDTAIVVMEQSYFGWFPYDGAFERRSRVTDTWVKRDGEWRIAKRVSEPRS